MTPIEKKKKTPDWLLERLAQGELDAAAADVLRARLAAEGRSLDAELGALERSNQEIRAAHPRGPAVAAIRRRAEAAAAVAPPRRPRGRRWEMPIFALALAGSLGVALVMVRGRPNPPAPGGGGVGVGVGQPANEQVGIKGDPARAPHLLVYRQRQAGTGSERLSDGARAARGDLLQLAYTASTGGVYGVLLSIDGAGRVTQHLPQEGDGARQAPRLRSAREIPLPSAYQLDDAPGFERFVLITAPESFPVAAVMRAARALAAQGPRARSLPLALPPSFQQTSVALDKSKGTP
jgi:hypothetical protein